MHVSFIFDIILARQFPLSNIYHPVSYAAYAPRRNQDSLQETSRSRERPGEPRRPQERPGELWSAKDSPVELWRAQESPGKPRRASVL